MDDFVNAIAYEVKLEIANRYFGFRTSIEGEIDQYLARLEQAKEEHLDPVTLDLLRMRALLDREPIARNFLSLIKFPDTQPKQDAILPAPDHLFNDLKGIGFTRWWRYRDLAFRVYRSLAKHIASNRQVFLDLSDDYCEICTRIDDFHRNNDLDGILSFLRTFDAMENERLKFLHIDPSIRSGKALEQDLRIRHPRPVTDFLPDLPAVPPLAQIKGSLDSLLKSAYSSLGSVAALPI
jgi:hypothetical protein